MTIKPEHVGRNDVTERELFLLSVPRIVAVPTPIDIGSKYFGVLLACNADNEHENHLKDLGRRLLPNGMRYFCSWGSECERVHDLFDRVINESNQAETDGSVIMTMWLDEETLDEALWQFLYVAFPANDYSEECKADLVIVVGNDGWAKQTKARLSDLDTLENEVVGKD